MAKTRLSVSRGRATATLVAAPTTFLDPDRGRVTRYQGRVRALRLSAARSTLRDLELWFIQAVTRE